MRGPSLLLIAAPLLGGCVVTPEGKAVPSPYVSQGGVFGDRTAYHYHPGVDLAELLLCPLVLPVDALLAMVPHLGWGKALFGTLVGILPGVSSWRWARRGDPPASIISRDARQRRARDPPGPPRGRPPW